MMDSGATHHIMPHRSNFKDYTLIKGSIHLGDKSTADQIGIGLISFTSPQGFEIMLKDVLHVPSVHMCFLSSSTMTDKGAKIIFGKKDFKILVNNQCIAKGYKDNKLYWLDTANISLNAHSTTASLQTWHQRMGHMSYAALKKYGPTALKGMDLNGSTEVIPSICTGYELGKST